MGDSSAKRPKVFLVGNPDKPEVPEVMAELREWLAERAEVVGAVIGRDTGSLAKTDVDLVIVLGGDGTVLGVARAMGAAQQPVVGVNLSGKLGYLAEFSAEGLKEHFTEIVGDCSSVCERMMIHVSVRRADGGENFASLAANDCVIHAGPPFRVVNLDVRIDGEVITTVTSDGLILATPTGSTAYNVSADGPIVDPAADAICLTPICPHSLTHRPLVVGGDKTVEVVLCRANKGSALAIDGQVLAPLSVGDAVRVRRADSHFRLIRDPSHSPWHTLVTKLRWGQAPARV